MRGETGPPEAAQHLVRPVMTNEPLKQVLGKLPAKAGQSLRGLAQRQRGCARHAVALAGARQIECGGECFGRHRRAHHLIVRLADARTHLNPVWQHAYLDLRRVMNGYFNYFAVPTNNRAINSFHYHVIWHWHRVLRRRSQNGRMPWGRMKRLIDRWLPPARLRHPLPDVRFSVMTRGGSPVR